MPSDNSPHGNKPFVDSSTAIVHSCGHSQCIGDIPAGTRIFALDAARNRGIHTLDITNREMPTMERREEFLSRVKPHPGTLADFLRSAEARNSVVILERTFDVYSPWERSESLRAARENRVSLRTINQHAQSRMRIDYFCGDQNVKRSERKSDDELATISIARVALRSGMFLGHPKPIDFREPVTELERYRKLARLSKDAGGDFPDDSPEVKAILSEFPPVAALTDEERWVFTDEDGTAYDNAFAAGVWALVHDAASVGDLRVKMGLYGAANPHLYRANMMRRGMVIATRKSGLKTNAFKNAFQNDEEMRALAKRAWSTIRRAVTAQFHRIHSRGPHGKQPFVDSSTAIVHSCGQPSSSGV